MEIIAHQIFQTVGDFAVHPLFTWITILAQYIEDPDVLGQIEDAWHNFIDSGQAWAFAIGAFLGYAFKGFTSY